MLNYEFSMKKLFFIFLIFFLFNKTAFGKELKIECTVKKTDEKGNFYQIGDKTVWTYDLSSKKYFLASHKIYPKANFQSLLQEFISLQN